MQNRSYIATLIVGTVLAMGIGTFSGCSKRSEVSGAVRSEPVTPPAAPPQQLGTPIPTHPATETPRKGEYAGSLPDLDQRARSIALYKLAHDRTPEAVAVISKFLESEEKHLPDTLPDFEALQSLEKNPPRGEHWVNHLPAIMSALNALVRSDTESGRRMAQAFLNRFAAKHGHSKTGQFLSETFTREVQESQKSVEAGFAPWKRGLPVEREE